MVIDADSTVSRDLLLGFAAAIETGYDWIQCRYDDSNPGASWRTKLMAYAFCLFDGMTAGSIRFRPEHGIMRQRNVP